MTWVSLYVFDENQMRITHVILSNVGYNENVTHNGNE